MAISKLRLTDFRNFKNKLIEFSPNTTVIVGPNASGKTNILESIYLVSTAKSFRARIEEEMINYQKELARVKAKTDQIHEVVLTRGEITLGTSKPERVARKRLLLNNVGKRLIDFVGNFRVVLFDPWDLDLVTQSPSLRRNFFDGILSQVDKEYRRASLSYEKGLRQRNKLLFRIREENLSKSQLLFWDRLLIKNGDYLSRKRQEFIDFANLTQSLDNQKFHLEYDKSAISEGRLEQYAQEEIAAATTLVGPHRDDFCFKEKDRELARFGSRGEQRMAVLWLKLAELLYIEKNTQDKPTLLLDDIISELDKAHRKIVVNTIKNRQTIITTTDSQYIKKFGKVEKIQL